MKNTLKYKDFIASVEFSFEDNVLHGKLEGITDLVTFEANNVTDLKKSFKEAVDDYLDFCKEVGKEPMKPFKGSFNVRIGKTLHKKAFQMATAKQMSLNQFVQHAIEKEIDDLEHA